MRTSHGDQVNHRVGRSTNRRKGLYRALERLAGKNFRQDEVLVHYLDRRRPAMRASTLRRPSTAG